MSTRDRVDWHVLGAVVAGLVYGFLNLCAMFLIGYGVWSRTWIGTHQIALGAVYLLCELCAIYVLLAWTSKTVRNGAHIGFCIPWAILMLYILPQMFDGPLRESLPLLNSAILVWAVRFPGELVATSLSRLRNASGGDGGSTPSAQLAPARIWLQASIAWAVLGLAHSLQITGSIPVIGEAVNLANMLLLKAMPQWPLLQMLLMAVPGVVFAVFAQRAGAPTEIPRFPAIARWCALANLAAWLSFWAWWKARFVWMSLTNWFG